MTDPIRYLARRTSGTDYLRIETIAREIEHLCYRSADN